MQNYNFYFILPNFSVKKNAFYPIFLAFCKIDFTKSHFFGRFFAHFIKKQYLCSGLENVFLCFCDYCIKRNTPLRSGVFYYIRERTNSAISPDHLISTHTHSAPSNHTRVWYFICSNCKALHLHLITTDVLAVQMA